MANWSWLAPITPADSHEPTGGNIVFKLARGSNEQETRAWPWRSRQINFRCAEGKSWRTIKFTVPPGDELIKKGNRGLVACSSTN